MSDLGAVAPPSRANVEPTPTPTPAPAVAASTAALAKRLTWLIFFRSLMMVLLLVVTVLVNLGDPVMLAAPPQLLVFGSVAFSFWMILIGAFWQRWAPQRWLNGQVALQIGSDLVSATLLIFATGSTESAFMFLYALSTINAAALTFRRGALITASIATACYCILLVVSIIGLTFGIVEARRLALQSALTSLVLNGSVIFLVAMLASYITEQVRRADMNLEETLDDLGRLEALHAAVVSSLTSGLMAVDQLGHITLINRAGETLLGLGHNEAIGRPAAALIPDLQWHIGRAAPTRFETLIQRPTGARSFGLSVSPLWHAEQELHGTVVTFQDLTDIHELEMAIARSERLATLGRFAAGLAHELRNPLGSLTGCVELLRGSGSSSALGADQQRRLFDVVLSETGRLNKLVSDFLVYARPAPSDRRPIDLCELVRETAAVAERESKERTDWQLELVIGGEPTTVLGDPNQLKQVVWNLVRNAVQAIDDGGRVRIEVRPGYDRRGRPAGLLVVEDSGHGVPDELRGRVFEPFFTTKEGGTGLGLPTVQRIVEEHAGTVEVGSSDLGGARFEIWVPQPVPEQATDSLR